MKIKHSTTYSLDFKDLLYRYRIFFKLMICFSCHDFFLRYLIFLFTVLFSLAYHHHHQSRLTSWGRSALQLQRSTAMSHATSAEVPVSNSTCRTQVCLGRRGRRFQCGLLSGRRPARVSTASRIAIRPGASSGSRRTCPKTAARRLQMLALYASLFTVKGSKQIQNKRKT